MFKVSPTSKDHCHISGICRLNHLGISNGAPGWITAVAPASAAAISPSAKGENASEQIMIQLNSIRLPPPSKQQSLSYQLETFALLRPRAWSHSSVNNSIRFKVFNHLPAKTHCTHFHFCWLTLRNDLPIRGGTPCLCPVRAGH